MPESILNISETGGATVVAFCDNAILDTLTVQRVSRELYELADRPAAVRLVIDFNNVRFLSSQALGMLLTLRRKADNSGALVVFARLRPELARVFQLTKLDTMFRFFDGVEAALTHLAEAPPPGG